MLPLRDVIPSRTTPWVTLALIAVNGLVFAYGWLLPSDVLLDVLTRYSLVPVSATFATATSAMFFHENLLHAGSNLVALWLFGENVEDRLGHGRYLTLYFAAGYAGTSELSETYGRVSPRRLNAC